MTIFDFFILLQSNIWLYFVSLGIIFIVYYFVIKSILRIKSILDPVFFASIGALFANTIPLFLYLCGIISNRYVIYLVCIETVFWGAYLLFQKRATTINKHIMHDGKASFSTFKIMLAICVGSYLLTYAVIGIPILKGSYTETFSEGGGWGILAHIQGFSLFFVIIYSFYLINTHNHTLLAKGSLLLSILFCLLSGSKSSILTIAFGYFFYLYYYCNKTFNLKKYFRYVLLICLFPIITLMIHSGSNISDALWGVIERFVAFGDLYWMALPNDTIDHIIINHPCAYILQGVLGPLRLIDYSAMDTNIGIQLSNLVYPDLKDIQFAPNSRLALLGWTCFGWNGLIFSFILGSMLAFIRTRLFVLFPKGIISVIVYGYIYTKMTSLLGDPTLAIGNLFSIILFGVVIWILLYLFYGRTITLKIDYKN